MDQADLKILQALQANARISNLDLARACDLAPSTTLERVRKLEERGVIRGYRAAVDARALGFELQAMVMISLGRHQSNPIESFEAAVRGIPEARACFHLTGRYDYLVRVVVRDIEHLRELVTKRLAAIPGVEKEETFIVLSAPKEDEGQPLELIAADRVDQIRPAMKRSGLRGSSPGGRAARRHPAHEAPPHDPPRRRSEHEKPSREKPGGASSGRDSLRPTPLRRSPSGRKEK